MSAITTPWALFIVEAMRMFTLLAGIGVALLALVSLWAQRHSRPPS